MLSFIGASIVLLMHYLSHIPSGKGTCVWGEGLLSSSLPAKARSQHLKPTINNPIPPPKKQENTHTHTPKKTWLIWNLPSLTLGTQALHSRELSMFHIHFCDLLMSLVRHSLSVCVSVPKYETFSVSILYKFPHRNRFDTISMVQCEKHYKNG